MNRAAAAFVGEHDFASLCRAADGGTTERTVEAARWEREGAPSLQRPASSGTTAVRESLSPLRGESRGSEATEGRGVPTSGEGDRVSRERVVDPLLVFSVSAKAFCHQMVRSMVALCVDVGRGRLAADAVPGILERKDRNAARGVAPPHGLVLWEVEY
jgi:tRNA pseudouridine38-40 synthase